MGVGSFGAGSGSSAGVDPIAPPVAVVGASNEVYFDPATRAWRISGNAIAEMHWVDQAMTLRLTTAKGAIRSSPGIGVDREVLKRVNARNAQSVVENVVNETIADLLAVKAVEIIEIVVEYSTIGELGFAVKYRNLLLPASPPRTIPGQ